MLERIYSKFSKRVMSLLLAVCMVISTSPPMMAAAVTDSGEPVVLSGFAELPEHIREQSVPIGTSSVELNLPSTLEATVYSVSEDTDTVPPVETPAPGTPAPPAEETDPTPPPSHPQDSGTVETPSPSAPKEPAPPADEAESADGSEPVTQVLSAYVESDVAVTVGGVTWQSDPLYDGETEGEYIFTAVLPEGYAVEDGIAMPEITVVVGQAEQSAVDKVIAMIDALPTMDEWTAMDETAARAVMDKILAAKAAYDALTNEDKALIDEARTAKLTGLAEMAEQLAGIMPMAAADFGTNCTWEITAEGVLILAPKTLGGTGTLPVFDNYSSQPWNSQSAKITSVKVESGVKATANSIYLFEGLSACTKMDLSGLDTSNTTNMSSMFDGCKALTSLDLSKFNTALVTNMSYMFKNCSGLTTLDLSKFDTALVTTMECMFDSCSKLTSIIFGVTFTTVKVTDMNNMFYGCKALTSLDLSKFNTEKVTKMGYMFQACSGLTTLDLSKFDTAKVMNMSSMFSGCSDLTSLTFGENFTTASVTSMGYMFRDCSGLTTLDLSKFDTAAVTNMSNMFNGCSGLTTLDLSKFDTAAVTSMGSMFMSCSKLASLDLSGFNTAAVTNMSSMFYGCSVLDSLDLSSFNTAAVTNMSSMFYGCGGLTSITFGEKFNTAAVTDMSSMFYGCSVLDSLDLSSFNTAKVMNMGNMFSACKALTSITFGENFTTASVTSMGYMFRDCSGLTTLDLSKFDTAAVTNMSNMFNGCSGLTTLDLSKFDTASVTSMGSMFMSCSKLASLDLSGFDFTKVTSMTNMLNNCDVGLKTNVYKLGMSGTAQIYLYDKHSKDDLTTTDLDGTEANIVYKPYAITKSATNGTITTSSRFNATDYQNYFTKTAGFYTSGAPTYDSAKDYAQQGETVTVTLAGGGTFESITVMQGGTTISTTPAGDNKYTFPMPAGDVTITAQFTTAAPVVNVTDKEIYARGVELKIIEGASWAVSNILYDKNGDGTIGNTEYLKIGDEEPTADGYNLADYKVFGGKNGEGYTGSTKITMTGGYVWFIYGGGKKGTVTGNTSIVMEGGDVFSLYGAGYEDASNTDAITVDGNTSVSITGGDVFYLYGGGENGKMTGNTTVAISGTAYVDQRAYGGGNNDIVGGNTAVNMTGGNVSTLYGEGDIYNGTKVSGTVAITITGGKIWGYVAIDSDNVNTGSTLTIGGGADISASYGGIIIKSAQDNTGVESFAISPALTGADGSISVCLTADTFVEDAIIATGAVAGDAAKITITSMSGIDGKEAYFDSSDNTIKMRSSFQKTDISDKLTISIGGGWGYGETAKTPSVTATGVTIDQSKLTYTYSGTANDGTTLTDSTTPPTLPGSYTVTASYEDDTQKGAATVSFTVAKAPLTITGGTVTSRGYIAEDKTATVTAVTFGGLKNGETLAITTDYTVTGAEFADANVGTNKPVTATVALKPTAKTANYTLSNSQLNTTGTITQEADGTKNPDYAAALAELKKVHIITNVTPTLGDVTLPAGWSFTGDPATRLAGIEGQANQDFAVKYTSQNPNYPDVVLLAQAFPVTTVLMDVQSGLSMVTLNKDEVKDIAPVTVAVKGAPLPNSGDYAESNIGLFSALPKIATISGNVGANQGAVNVTGVAKGLTMVGIAYKNTPTMMLGYILIQVNDPAASSQNNIEEIKDIGDTLERLIADPSQPTAVEQATVNAVASEITKLPDTAKAQLTVDDVKKIDALQQTVQNITVTPTLPVVAGAPTLASNFTVVGAAVASGAAANDTVTITATPKPVSGEIKMELDLAMTVGSGEQQLKSPLFFEMELPAGIDPAKLKISHILAGGSTEEVTFTASGQTVSFKLNSFSGLQFIVSGGGSGGGQTGGGGSGGSSGDDGYDFWMQVKDKIEKADDGDVIKANAKDHDKMPESVMDALRKNDDVSLVITWNGKPITIPAGKAQKKEPGRIYWPLSLLAELYAGIAEDTVLKLEPQNPETGGPSKYIPVTGGELITLEAPAPAVENAIPDATENTQAIKPTQPKAITPPDAGFEADAFVGTPDAKAARSTNGIAIAGFIMLLVALCASGVWLWKRRTQRE